MGLDTSHNAWHGPYSSFNKFRTDIAKNIGINLRQMEGFGGSESWDKFKDHPLYPLLFHSDCDGKIEVEHLKGIADSLIEISPKLERFQEQAIDFANGCLLALSKNEPIDFH